MDRTSIFQPLEVFIDDEAKLTLDGLQLWVKMLLSRGHLWNGSGSDGSRSGSKRSRSGFEVLRLRIPDNGKCFHSKIATLCQIGWIWKESKTFRSFGCFRIQSSRYLRQISTKMYCFGQVASRTKLSSCWHSSCNEPRGKTQTIPSFQGKYPSH